MLSFRYSQIIDEESLQELSLYVEQLRREGVEVIFTGLHRKLIEDMEAIEYFHVMQKEDKQNMYSLETGE